MTKKLMLLFFIALMGKIYSSGFQINECGAKAQAMGDAFTAIADDASAIHFNPAGMSFMEKSNFSAGVALIKPESTFRGPLPENKEYSLEKKIFTPVNLYGVYVLDDKWSFGMGLTNPYGLATNWDKDWVGKYLAVDSEITTFFTTFAASYRINDRLSISAGPVISYGEVKITKMKSLAPVEGDAYIDMEGDDVGYGFTAGIMYKPLDNVSFGVSYRSEVKFEFEGKADSEGPAQFDDVLPNDADIQANMTTPRNITFGAAYDPTKDITVAFDFQYVGWSSYDKMAVDFVDEKYTDTSSIRDYNNTYILRLGTEYRANEKTSLRAGIFYDNSPVEDKYVEPSLPDTDRLGFNAGFGYKITEGLSLDMAYLYLRGEERKITESHVSYTDGNAPFNGVYNSSVNILSFNVSYSF